MFRVIYRTPHAKQSKMKDPPKTSGLWADSQMSCGTLDVNDDKAAPIPNVIITAGNVQQIRVERLVAKATIGAAVSLRASRVLLILQAYDFAGGINSLPSLRVIFVVE